STPIPAPHASCGPAVARSRPPRRTAPVRSPAASYARRKTSTPSALAPCSLQNCLTVILLRRWAAIRSPHWSAFGLVAFSSVSLMTLQCSASRYFRKSGSPVFTGVHRTLTIWDVNPPAVLLLPSRKVWRPPPCRSLAGPIYQLQHRHCG